MLFLMGLVQADCLSWAAPVAVATARNATLDEVSGLAISSQHPGIGWVIEDSGNRPIVYGIELATGKLLSRLKLKASNQDWEDLALGACQDDPARTCIWVGEFGDNGAHREDLGLFSVPEPTTLKRAERLVPVWFPFRYPEKQDTEAMYFGADGVLRLVTKRKDGDALVYQIPKKPGQQVMAVEETRLRISKDGATHPVEERPPWRVTAAAREGEGLLLRSYEGTFLFRAENRTELLSPAEPQGEAIAIDPRDQSLWFVSEQSPIFYRAACSERSP